MANHPSYVYGYISLVDPDTGELNLVRSPQFPDSTWGSVDVILNFRSLDDGSLHPLEFEHGACPDIKSVSPRTDGLSLLFTSQQIAIAYLYIFALNADRNCTQPPAYEPNVNFQHPDPDIDVQHAIRYNPDHYVFECVEIGEFGYHFPDPDGEIGGETAYQDTDNTGTVFSIIPLNEREEPFPELPDLF